ncbi:hypothetical protein EPN29_14045 [bacterium]|nr:MAG: hypothetical protein EPN29_14045 [bacterium]
MTYSLEEFDSLLSRAQPVSSSTPVATLRKWRTELVRASVFVSFAIGVLSVDFEVLKEGLEAIESSDKDVLQSIVDDLPSILASGWVGGGWSLSPDASASVGAAAELSLDNASGLLELHTEIASSNLGDPVAVRDLMERVSTQRLALIGIREQLEGRIKQIQQIVRQHYAAGTASVDDWLA